jgi:PAS domain S-box-containing protein
MKRLTYLSNIAFMLIAFSLLISVADFFTFVINSKGLNFASIFFSTKSLILLSILSTAIAFIYLTKSAKTELENYEFKKSLCLGVNFSSFISVISTDANGNVVSFNNYTKELLGIDPSNKNIYDILPISSLLENDTNFIENGVATLENIRIKTNSSQEIWVDIFIQEVQVDETKTLLFMLKDATEKHKARETYAIFRGLLESLEEGIVIVNKEGYIIEFNNSFAEVLDMQHKDIVNQKFIDLVLSSNLTSNYPKEVKEQMREKMTSFLKTLDYKNFRNPIKFSKVENGSLKHYLHKVFTINLDENNFLIGGIILDVTELQNLIDKVEKSNVELEQIVKEKTAELENKVEILNEVTHLLNEASLRLAQKIEERNKIEAELAKNEENYRNFIENLPVGIYRTNEAGNMLLANTALAHILGCSSVSELLQHSAYDFYPQREYRGKVLKSHLTGEKELIRVGSELITKDGRRIFVYDYGRSRIDPETKEVLFDGVIIDVTEKHLLEKELEKREKQLRQMFEMLNEILFQMDEEGKIVVVSPSVQESLGYSNESLLGKEFQTLLTKPEWFDKIKHMLEDENPLREILLEFKDKDGNLKFLKGDYFLFIDEETGKKHYQTLLRDITEEVENQNLINAILKLYRTFSKEQDIYEIADNILKAFRYIVTVPNYIFAIYEQETNSLKIIRHFDRFGYSFHRLDIRDKSHPIIDSFHKQALSIYTDKELTNFWNDERIQSPSYLISIPLVCTQGVIGIVAIYTYAHSQELSKANRYYLTTLSEQITLGLERKLLSDKLSLQLGLFASLVESIPYPIYYRDLKTRRYRYCNNSFEIFAEKPRAEILGKTPDEVFTYEIAKFMSEKNQEILETHQTQNFELKKTDSFGNERTYISIRTPIVVEELNEEAVVGILIDITERLNYEAELQQALSYNKLLIDLMPSGFYAVNSDMIVTSWNKQAEMITGYSADEVIGKECLFCRTVPGFKCDLLENKPTEETKEQIFKFTNKEGKEIILLQKEVQIVDKEGKIIGAIASFEDITTKKKYEEQLSYLAETNARLTTISNIVTSVEEYESLYDIVMPAAVQITNSSGAYYFELRKINETHILSGMIEFNKDKEKKQLQLPLEKWLNTYIGKVYIEREPLVIENAERNKLIPELIHLEGKSLVVIPIQSGEEQYGIVITYGKEKPYAQEEVNALNRLAMMLATNIDRIKYQDEMRNLLIKQLQINELRANFINLISHEYRTPLQAVILSAEILKKHLDKLSEEQKEKQFQRIEKAVKDMSDMLENVILYNKLSQAAEALRLEKVKSKVFFESLIKDYILYYQDIAKINYTIEAKINEINIDQQIIQLIFNNLISNAVKYSQPSPEIDVNVSIDKSGIRLKFSDNGIGIDEKEIDKIFEPFYRGKNIKTISGTGLGLSIVSNAVNLLGGTITVKSELGKGTTFEVLLPLL